MAVNGFTNIVTDGLVLSLDAGNLKSYPTTGTTWTDLSGNNYNTTLNNFGGQFFTSNNVGGIIFDGIDSYGIRNNVIRTGLGFDGTIEVITSCKGPMINNERTSDSTVGNGYFYTGLNKIYVGVNSYNLPPYTYASTSTISGNDGQLNYYAASYQIPLTSGTMSGVFFINGVFENFSNSLLVAGGIVQNYTNIEIGRHRNSSFGTAYCSSGTTSVVRIYNRRLSNSEIQQNYNATKWRFI